MENKPGFFDFAAEVGLTKHIGGVEATQALVELCHIGKGSYLLDVGCGVGATACYLAKNIGCRVMGVDISPKMVERSQERAAQEKVLTLVEFRVADAQNLPFENATFDAVITESVTAFPDDKQKAVQEYARVAKRGGYVGLNESIWRKLPPPPEVITWASQDVGANLKPLTPDAWRTLLENAGVKDIIERTYDVNIRQEGRGLLRRYGWGGMLKVMGRMLRLYARSPDYRKFVKDVSQGNVVPPNLTEYFGYGLFVGRVGA